MTKKKADSATAVMDAPVSMITTSLKLVFCSSPGPRPDGLNLWVDIDINFTNGTALFHCAPKEIVGTHPNRTVTYRADHSCRLTFTNPDIFGVPSVDLKMNQQKLMHIPNNKHNISANYGVEVEATNEQIASWAQKSVPSVMATPDALAGPHIVVP